MCRGRGGGCSAVVVPRMRCILWQYIMAVRVMVNAYKYLQRASTNCSPVEEYAGSLGSWISFSISLIGVTRFIILPSYSKSSRH
jgi:hypothetical protein